MAGLLALFLGWLLQEQLFPASAVPDGVAVAWLPLAGLAVSAIGGALVNRKKGGGGAPGDRELMHQERADRARGGAAEEAYYDYLSGFDATDATRRTAGALSHDWLKKFGRETEDLRGNQVSRGRLDTGYGFEDEDRYVDDFNDDVARTLDALAMDTTRMNLAAKSDLGRYGERVTGRSIDTLQTRRQQALADRASKRSMYGSIGGSLINAAGTYFGNR